MFGLLLIMNGDWVGGVCCCFLVGGVFDGFVGVVVFLVGLMEVVCFFDVDGFLVLVRIGF